MKVIFLLQAAMTQGQVQVQYVASQPGSQGAQPVIVIAGTSGVVPQQPMQQSYMCAAAAPPLQQQQFTIPPGSVFDNFSTQSEMPFFY